MKKNGEDTPDDRSTLRRRAEARLRGRYGVSPRKLTPEEAQRLVHELEVHQAELEIQNEELLHARAELEKTLAEYTELYDFAPIGYFTLGIDGTIRAVNLTGGALLGVECSSLLGRRLGMYLAEGSRVPFADFLDKLFASGTGGACEVVFDVKGKSPLIAQIEATASRSREECRAVVFDVTERRKLEEQLRQAQKMEAVGLFTGGVAHDFNNMLTAIIGYGETIRENIHAGDESLRENIEQVLKAAGRAADLTARLLAFSRKQLTILEPVIIDAVIDDISKLIRRVIGADIELTFAFSCDKLVIMADVGQIEMALMNLATNARDAMPRGGRLSISTKQVLVEKGSESLYDLKVPGRYALVSVADTGSGISKDSLEKLFQPFYTTKEMGKGTGLGLSIVHGIVKQHNGSVMVDSQPGAGATFKIYLPLFEGREVRPERKMPAPLVRGTETILLAEDEEMVRLFMGRILENAGYTVIPAENGEEALTRFKENDDIALVLSDVVMPGKSGNQMFEEMRRIKPGVKVIFISGYTPDIMQSKGLDASVVDFITKPFQKSDVLAKIREVLDRDT
jgi:signal transduction histidine kinase/CheY-like chemotaxis protein